jgi:adenylate kinase
MTAIGPRLVLLGKPGSGKGTQSTMLSNHYGVEHLSTGDIFRAAVAEGTPTGLEVKRFMDTGELVPDEIVIRVVDEHFAEGGPLTERFILDGFPRTLVQAEELEKVLGQHGHPLDLVLDLEVPTEIILDRIAGRRVCVNCGASYHVNKRPSVGWTCDVCGGDVVQRDDDTEDAVARRLSVYEQQTVPIIDFYRQLGKLVVVDGVGNGDEVYERLQKEIDGRFDSAPR